MAKDSVKSSDVLVGGEPRYWAEIEPKDATTLNAITDPTIIPPLNELGEECPWPWDPQQLEGAPMGQYHCPYCGGMQLAGLPHNDLRDEPELAATPNEDQS